jgi:hypothetical protein
VPIVRANHQCPDLQTPGGGCFALQPLFHRPSGHKTETQRVDEFDPAVPRDGSFYKDDRHVGLWAKKRLKQLGVDLGPKFDETVELARSGKFPKSELT